MENLAIGIILVLTITIVVAIVFSLRSHLDHQRIRKELAELDVLTTLAHVVVRGIEQSERDVEGATKRARALEIMYALHDWAKIPARWQVTEMLIEAAVREMNQELLMEFEDFDSSDDLGGELHGE